MAQWRKILFFFAMLLSGCTGELVHRTISYTPNEEQGQDAIISKAYPNNNYDGLKYLHLTSRIKGDSIEDDNRFVLSFDIDSIIGSSKVDSAFIYLYGTHKSNSGDYSFSIQRITYPWIAKRITWKNQPKVETKDEIKVTKKGKNFKIDVTPFVKGFAKKEYRNLGFMFRLVDENQENKKISFHSSNGNNQKKRPKIEISYRIRQYY